MFPVRYSNVDQGWFSEEAKIGGLNYDVDGDEDLQAAELVALLADRIISDREAAMVELTSEME